MTNYATTLRSVLLHSGDVLPDEVSAYLQQVAQKGGSLQEEVLALYRPLVEYLPAAFTDFALSVLLPKPRRRRGWLTGPFSEGISTLRQLGFPYFRLFTPPAPVQGPFLCLLRKSENQGLRLIHGLANAAVAEWRERMQRPQDGEGVTPIQIVVAFPSGARSFWGNSRVYYWFRPNSYAPDSVGCALMALELWMEEEVERGRDCEELFATVVASSDCVAVLGVCVAIALAYPDRALRAALPLVTTPLMWRMDKARWVADQQSRIPWPDFLTNQTIDKLNEARSVRPQRARDIRTLAPLYLFGQDEAQREAFRKGLSLFADESILPIPYEEWRLNADYLASTRKEMELCQLFADTTNYVRVRVEGGFGDQFRLPAPILERENERLAPITKNLTTAVMVLWAWRAIETGVLPPNEATPEDALRWAREQEQHGGLSAQDGEETEAEAQRIAAIIGVAAALLVTNVLAENDEASRLWARGIVLRALRSEESALQPAESRARVGLLHLRTVSARALCALAGTKKPDNEVRETIIRLVADQDEQVRSAAVSSLFGVWTRDPALCWVAVNLAVELELEPRPSASRFTSYEHRLAQQQAQEQAERVADLIAKALDRLRRAELPAPPRIDDTQDRVLLFPGGVLPALEALDVPATLADPEGHRRVLQLVDDLTVWTVARNRRPHKGYPSGNDREPHEWNRQYTKWLAGFSRLLSLDEARRCVLTPIRDAWREAPSLTEYLMEGLIEKRLSYMGPLDEDIQTIWREVCNWVIQSPEVQKLGGDVWKYHHLTRGVEHSVHLVVSGTMGSTLMNSGWPHARAFIDLWTDWVRAVGHYPEPYSYLIAFLEGPGWSCVPEPGLHWLDDAFQAASDLEVLLGEHSNAARTASLLQRMLEGHKQAIRGNADSRRRFSDVVDLLVRAGSTVGAVLQRELENRG